MVITSQALSDAQSYTISTERPPQADGAVDIMFKCQNRVIGISVKANAKESELQRIVADTMQLNLNGYWVATITEGEGRIGALISGATVTLTRHGLKESMNCAHLQRTGGYALSKAATGI
jgi:hypothetical protein